MAIGLALAAAAGSSDAAEGAVGGRTGFRLVEVRPESLEVREGERPVLVYNHGVMRREGVPADRVRSSYVHPIHGLDGEVLTDDFPKDHYHHRGLFWSWPHVGIGEKDYDLWALSGIQHRFGRWLAREAGEKSAVLEVENGWYVGEERVMRERIRLTVYAAAADERNIDLDCTWVPEARPIRLSGAEGKSYGGITLRYAPGTNTVIATPQGRQAEDLYITKLPWADLSRRFEAGPAGGGGPITSGAALFIAPDHPDYPPTWLTRHYGVLCVGWPGVKAREFPAGEPIRCRYRVWIHRGEADPARAARAYEGYAAGIRGER